MPSAPDAALGRMPRPQRVEYSPASVPTTSPSSDSGPHTRTPSSSSVGKRVTYSPSPRRLPPKPCASVARSFQRGVSARGVKGGVYWRSSPRAAVTHVTPIATMATTKPA